MTGECPVCGGTELDPLVERRSVPVLLNRVFEDADAARLAPSGTLALVMCTECGFTFNRAFDAALVDYSPEYENDQTGSPLFYRHIDDLIARIADHQRAAATIIEIEIGRAHV